MEITGEITAIIYQNEINSYTIADMYVDGINGKEDKLITVVGYLPFVTEGDELKLIGNFTEHKEYGEQFKIQTFEKIMPQTLEALEKYLGNGLAKGIGQATAKKIIKTFGEETINIIKYEPSKLTQIRGITEEKAFEFSKNFIEHWEVWQIIGFLEKFGIGAENAKKVYDKFGISAIEQIKANPYMLIDIARGVDFKQIDKMAIDLGIELNNNKRIKSGIKYALMKITYSGHCCTLQENLIEYVRNLLGIEADYIEDNLINLKVNSEIIEEQREDGKTWIYLANFYNTERNIAKRIKLINNAENNKYIKDIKGKLKLIELEADIELSDKQKEAINLINENNLAIITGGPGTGKTTVIRTIIELYKSIEKKVVLSAPTGRAAKRMSEATGEDAATLHRLLEIGNFTEDIYNKDNSEYQGTMINADVIIVDEMSMVDMFLMNYLLNAIYQGTKLILVGDSDQLASVGPGSILKDLIESEIVCTIKLDKVFRQAAKSQIVVNAHRVNEGYYFIGKEESQEDTKEDFFVINEANQEKMLGQVLSLCTGRLQNYGNYDFFNNMQVLTPTRKGMFGTKEINAYLQNALNPESDKKDEKRANGAIYRVGDRVMQIKNNYDMYWEKNGKEKEVGTGVFNGEIGRIINISDKDKQVEIKFDDEKIAWYTFNELEQIEHSYAITIHKSQGSEFDVVVMCIPKTAPVLLTRNLLYTGITRAKELLVIVGDKKIIEYMIQNIDSKKRNTGLKYKLQEE